MNLSCLLSLLREEPAYRQLAERLLANKDEQRATVLDSAKPFLIATLYEDLNLPILLITAQPDNAKKRYEQLQVWCSSPANLQHFPEIDLLPYEHLASYSTNATRERLKILAALAASDPERPPLIVTSALAAMSKTVPKDDFVSTCHVLRQGMTIDLPELLSKWQGMGYEMDDTVETPGAMSRRGGIIDIFPIFSQLPARVELWGNKIESMRLFDPRSQRGVEPISQLSIISAKELLPSRAKQINSLNLDSCIAEVKRRFEEDIARLEQRNWFPGSEFYSPLFNTGSFLDYLHNNALVILDVPEEIEAASERLCHQAQELRESKVEHGELPQGFPSPYFSWEELEAKLETKQRLILSNLNPLASFGDQGDDTAVTALPFALSQSYGGKLEAFLKTVKQMMEQNERLIVISQQANRLAELFQEEDIHASPSIQIERAPHRGSITLLQGSLPQGWLLRNKLSLITDAEIFGFVKQRRPSKRTPVRASLLLPQLSPGDYVVHIDHGIGRFNGLIKMSTNGAEREYLVLEYAAGDKLYVPTDQIGRISRYIGASDQAPSLSRLGTREWQRTKKRVEESIIDIAKELVGLYATREVSPGFAFSPDTLWQQELEASFPYTETPDQLETIIAVKEDMEKPKPMDRLICGDVGYGKTEIALRAAFKAVTDNKQVAILVPTTVLAQQHFATFRERLQAFPVTVEMLSRFCSREKEEEILQGLARGAVDICIGTHRLLQKDVSFKNLGLVIIDEEQRFGVAQKEKLKQMRQEVDVLTLSATPIPRTLHMALTGIRDMSIMETAPEERQAIRTYVGAYDDDLVRQAMLRELDRNGQVFFVHNRVQSIAFVANKLQALIPEAKIAIAHGQMPEEKLERVMLDFIAGRYDILLTTTIIQAGLDMPSVNTLIVDQADKLGLTQLYQLRGRVGRGVNQASAYFLFDKGKRLTPQAYKRLRTIFEATELGAGFGIAIKDLEIRGAGNLLGVKQSGHIAEVGFDLYCQLLSEAVEELKARQAGGERSEAISKKKAEFTPYIDLPLAAYIPEEYVPNLDTRLSLYQRLAQIADIADVKDVAKELRDRFGAPPEVAENLLYMVKIKVLATEAKVSSVSTQGRQIIIKPKRDAIAASRSPEPKLRTRQSLLEKPYNGAIKIGSTQIRLDTRHLGAHWSKALEEILRQLG